MQKRPIPKEHNPELQIPKPSIIGEILACLMFVLLMITLFLCLWMYDSRKQHALNPSPDYIEKVTVYVHK